MGFHFENLIELLIILAMDHRNQNIENKSNLIFLSVLNTTSYIDRCIFEKINEWFIEKLTAPTKVFIAVNNQNLYKNFWQTQEIVLIKILLLHYYVYQHLNAHLSEVYSFVICPKNIIGCAYFPPNYSNQQVELLPHFIYSIRLFDQAYEIAC